MVANIARNDLFLALAFNNELADRKSALKRLNGNIRATSCPNIVNFRPIIWEFTLLKRAIFATIRPQFVDVLHSSRWRFQMHWKIAILISAKKSAIISVHLVEIWWDTVQWPQSLRHKNLYSWRRVEWPLLFPLAFDNGMADHKSAFRRFNGSNSATSYSNLVNFRPTMSEFSLLKCAIFATIHPQFYDVLHSSRRRSKTDWKSTILILAE